MEIPAPRQESRGIKRRLPEKRFSQTQNASSGRKHKRWRRVGLARCRLGNEGQGCQVVDGMTVPQPRDKTWGRRELGREVLKFCTGVGR